MGRTRDKQLKLLQIALEHQLKVGLHQGAIAAIGQVILETARNVLRLERKESKSAAEQYSGDKLLKRIGELTFDVWGPRWAAMLAGPLSALMRQSTEEMAPVLGSFDLANPRIQTYFDAYVDRLSGDLSQTSRDNARDTIQQAIDEGLGFTETADLLEERLDEIDDARARLIARTELTSAQNGASLIQAAESGVIAGKRWIATRDARTRPVHRAMDGEVAPLHKEFSNGVMFPNEPNCRCSLGWEVDPSKVPGYDEAPPEPDDPLKEERENYNEAGRKIFDELRADNTNWDRLGPDGRRRAVQAEAKKRRKREGLEKQALKTVRGRLGKMFDSLAEADKRKILDKELELLAERDRLTKADREIWNRLRDEDPMWHQYSPADRKIAIEDAKREASPEGYRIVDRDSTIASESDNIEAQRSLEDLRRSETFVAERYSDLPNSWNGSLEVNDWNLVRFLGVKEWSCAIGMTSEYLMPHKAGQIDNDAQRKMVLLHETFHAISPQFNDNPPWYGRLRGWEEAPVEMLARLNRLDAYPELRGNDAARYALDESDLYNSYNGYIRVMDQMRNWLNQRRDEDEKMGEREFYEWLFKIPLIERPAAMNKAGLKRAKEMEKAGYYDKGEMVEDWKDRMMRWDQALRRAV